MNSLVSVVVPVFNAKRYLRRCLNSIGNQTYKNIEVILVDDGSTDGSSVVLDKYAQKDSRFKVVHCNNSGVSVARNVGIDIAGGYITFVDADDWLPNRSIEIRVNKILETGAQVCGGNYRKVFSRHSQLIKEYDEDFVISLKDTDGLSIALRSPWYSGWMMLFCTDIIKQNNLRFSTEITYNEDTLFFLQYLEFCRYIAATKENLYFYNRLPANSLTRKKYNDLHKIFKIGLVERVKLFKDKQLPKEQQKVVSTLFGFSAYYYAANFEKELAISKIEDLHTDYDGLIDMTSRDNMDEADRYQTFYFDFKHLLETGRYSEVYKALIRQQSSPKGHCIKSLLGSVITYIANFIIFDLRLGYKK